ncbi:hypothetical protein [Chromobacterium sinusclupearum]|uniref:hypothetical protein n=1 Tax=Chromobacterium sinusclupearum TaxID=2077146 RepID=UPI0011AEFD7F|nr:hypothetical protein [Chromobacterium sinusclupearum]
MEAAGLAQRAAWGREQETDNSRRFSKVAAFALAENAASIDMPGDERKAKCHAQPWWLDG